MKVVNVKAPETTSTLLVESRNLLAHGLRERAGIVSS